MRDAIRSPGLAVAMLAVTLAAPASAQSSRPATAATTNVPSSSLYAVNAASLATAMTYCMTTHGPLRVGSRGETCFRDARNLLAQYGLKGHAERIDRACPDAAQFNTCITPQIGRLVMELNIQLTARKP